jgi:ATP-dependent helicase/nuclease subunit B
VPEYLTASAFEDFITCPYRFFALRLLGLERLDALSEQLDRSDYGQLAHRLLAWLHATWAEFAAVDDAQILSAAREWLHPSRAASPMERAQRGAFAAMVARWLPQYLQWTRQREAQGWRVAGYEVPLQESVQIGGRTVQLRGRIDHLEKGVDGQIAVYDYKTQGEQTVKQLAQEPFEAVQLAFYGAMLAQGVSELGYVSLSSDKAQAVIVPGETSALVESVRQITIELMTKLEEGQPLPANGVQAACARCNAYGVCQRGYRA